MKELIKLVKEAVEDERQGANFYLKMMNEVAREINRWESGAMALGLSPDKKVVNSLFRLGERINRIYIDELEHKRFFEQVFESLT